MTLDLPLMHNNITADDRRVLIDFLQKDEILTQSKNVKAFEEEWSQWLGVKHSVFVNSGASANLITIAALKHLYGPGEVIVPSLTWVSDIASVLQNDLKPVFVDVDERTLGMDEQEVLRKITPQTRAVFLTHVLGLNGMSRAFVEELKRRKILLIEDVCESHGATLQGQKCGSIGWASNFSFYYAHHMSTIEGGMVCTNDEDLYQVIRMLRSHGMVREATSDTLKAHYRAKYPELNPDFIFSYPAYNVRSTELNAVLGRNQLKRLDANNQKRVKNFELFLQGLDSKKYRTDFALEGSVNYAFILILKNGSPAFAERVTSALRNAKVEFRRGLSGGGSQLRQPFLEKHVPQDEYKKYPKVDYLHFYGFYIGNYPDLEAPKIQELCAILNSVDALAS